MLRFHTLFLLGCLLAAGCSGESTPSVAETSAESSPGGPALRPTERQATDDWPRLYGTWGDCVSTETGLNLDWTDGRPPVLWSLDIGTGYSAPVIRDHQVILHHRRGDEERVTCLSDDDGEALWDVGFSTSFECDYEGYSSGPYSTPVIHGDSVFIQSAEGVVRRLRMADGSLVWERNLSADYDVPQYGYGVGHSPVIHGDHLILNIGGSAANSGVVALEAATGETVWTGVDLSEARLTGSHATPAIAELDDRARIVVLTGDRLACVAADTGESLWDFPITTHSRDTPNSTTPLVMGNRVLVASSRADTFCVAMGTDGTPDMVWQNARSLGSVFNPLTAYDNRVLGWHAFDKSLRCIDAETGELIWKQKTVFERGNHIAVGQRLIVLGESGHLGVVELTAGGADVLSVTEEPFLEGPCYTMPALSSGRLYVRNERQLICCDLRAAVPPLAQTGRRSSSDRDSAAVSAAASGRARR